MAERFHTPVLDVQGISFAYQKGIPVFSDVSLVLRPGEICTILGPNGAGKSTLLHCIGRQLIPGAGRIRIDGEDVARLSTQSLAQKVGYVAQSQSLMFDFTVRDYLLLGRAPHMGALRVPGRREYQIVDRALERMRITALADKSVLQISGGERQQVQIARVLVQDPRLILMDEPTNHLDYGNQIKVLKMIVQLAQETRATVVLTTHNPDHAILLGGKAGILGRHGRLVTGTTDGIVTKENLTRIYQADLCMAYIPEVGRTACVAGSIREPVSHPVV